MLELDRSAWWEGMVEQTQDETATLSLERPRLVFMPNYQFHYGKLVYSRYQNGSTSILPNQQGEVSNKLVLVGDALRKINVCWSRI